MKTTTKKTLTFDIETLVELTPENATQVNGGRGGKVSSVIGPQPPAQHHHHRHQKVSSVMPTATAI